MKLVNRCGWSLIPLQPYADWINSLPASITELSTEMTLAEHQAERRLYLTDEDREQTAQVAGIELPANWRAIFENELSGWDLYADHWPEISPALFQQWFALTPVALVFDGGEQPLLRATLE